jgi:hypothetical protein
VPAYYYAVIKYQRVHWSEWGDYKAAVILNYQSTSQSSRSVGSIPTVVKQVKKTSTKLKMEARMECKYKLKSKWVVAVVASLLLGLFGVDSTQPNVSL